MMELKEHPCDWCGSNQYSVVMQSRDYLTDKPGKFQFVKCAQCGLLRQNPRLDWPDLLTYYPDDFPSHRQQVSEIPSKLKRLNKRYGLWKRVRFINQYKSSGNWLDVGCGTGRLLQEAQLWDQWKLFGLEPISRLAEYTKTKLNIPTYPISFEDFQEDGTRFDIITMWDVLEHLPSPASGIRKVTRLLNQDGYFIFTIPNLNSIWRKIFKQSWIGYELPRHFYLYPPGVLNQMLEESGLQIINQRCIAGGHGTLMLDLVRWNKDKKFRFLSKLLDKGEDFLPIRLITLIPLWIIDKLKLGTNITYVAKKI